MKVLIIGGTGLISTAITRFLIERGDDVTLYNHDRDEPPIYSEIIERWKPSARKRLFSVHPITHRI